MKWQARLRVKLLLPSLPTSQFRPKVHFLLSPCQIKTGRIFPFKHRRFLSGFLRLREKVNRWGQEKREIGRVLVSPRQVSVRQVSRDKTCLGLGFGKTIFRKSRSRFRSRKLEKVLVSVSICLGFPFARKYHFYCNNEVAGYKVGEIPRVLLDNIFWPPAAGHRAFYWYEGPCGAQHSLHGVWGTHNDWSLPKWALNLDD